MAWLTVIYYGKCNHYVLINCIRYCIRGELIQNYFNSLSTNPQNGQTHRNNSSAICRQIV